MSIALTIEDAEDWIFTQDRVYREFLEHKQEEMIQLLQNICDEHKVTIKLLFSSIIEDDKGEEIESGEVYDAIWKMIRFDEFNYEVLGTMILVPKN